jgi:5'-3' exonuclease
MNQQPIRLHPQHAEIDPDVPLDVFEYYCEMLFEQHRGILWWIGDTALELERQHRNTHEQAWPICISPELLSRCTAVAKAYPPSERNIDATWSVHMHHMKRPDRVQAVGASVDQGQTSDEARNNPPDVQEEEEERWLLAVDVNLYLHAFFSTCGDEAAYSFTQWIVGVAKHLMKQQGLTDLVCCIDSTTNHRKEITKNWEHKYKDRGSKPEGLVEQLQLAEKMLRERNILCVTVPDMEGDDVMASYAAQFPGKVTLMTTDKDMRQCLSSRVNILKSAKKKQHPTTNKWVFDFQWLLREWKPDPDNPTRAKPACVSCHMSDGVKHGNLHVCGITPEQWPHFQALMGDAVDGVTGIKGFGPATAMPLIKEHGTVQNVINAAKDNDADVTELNRMKLLDFEEQAADMLKLTTMRTDLKVPMTTTITLQEGDD